MPVQLATPEDLPAIRRLLRIARHTHCNVADEDLAAVVRRDLSFLYGEQGLASGLILTDPEIRPRTLPSDAATRIQIRALAARSTGWYGSMLPDLLGAVRAHAAAMLAGFPAILHTFASEPWLGPALAANGFSQIETVIYFRKDRLQTAPLNHLARPAATLRLAQPVDLPALADLDIVCFQPFWHMGEDELQELLFRGRVTIAEVDGVCAGYTALLNATQAEAHLARIAVHPRMQGQGIGRLLLADALSWCRNQGCRSMGLNTQLSNGRSQTLYRAAGFRESGMSLPVYALKLP